MDRAGRNRTFSNGFGDRSRRPGVDPETGDGIDETDPFVVALTKAMTEPFPKVGDRVLVDGRPGVLIGREHPATCWIEYTVDHDGEVAVYVLGNFWLQSIHGGPYRKRENPVVEVV